MNQDQNFIGVQEPLWPAPQPEHVTPWPTEAPAKRKRSVGVLASATVLALGAGFGGGYLGYQVAADSPSATIAAPVSGAGVSPAADGTIAAVAAAVTPAVVNIEASSNGQGGTGSGFVITSDGYIVTNNHVIDGASDITVNFADGSSTSAELVGADAGYDIAVLKVNKTGLPVAALGSSAAVNVGDTAIAVGSPLGLANTVTSGIVSALDRPVTAGGQDSTSFINAVQTDAAINPGNSGGPLLNGDGEVIGVNSAIASLGASAGGQAGSIGLGFAIPIDTANRIVQEIIDTGSAQTPVIGIQVADGPNGPEVADLTPGGPAEAAGLQVGDVVTEVDGRTVRDATELIVAIRDNAVGDTVNLLVLRNGSELDLSLVLTAAPPQRG